MNTDFFTVRVCAPQHGNDFIFFADKTEIQYRSFSDPATGPEMEYGFTNAIGGAATYRVRVVSIEEVY